MDRDAWKLTLAAVKRAARRLPRPARRFAFADWLVVAMYLWAVAHDRPQSWACVRAHYTSLFRPRKLPSVSQFNRRVACERTRQLLLLVHQDLGGTLVPTAISYLDGKALPVGPCSKDPDAKRGKVYKGFAKGYKLHAWVTEDKRIPLWAVTALNVHESHVARLMFTCEFAPRLSDRSLVVTDGNYDDHELHTDVAGSGGRLLPGMRGLGQHPVTQRQMGPARRECVAAWGGEAAPLARMVHRRRIAVEQTFSGLCSRGGGLGPLPAWVRRLTRVRRWVGAKIILYHAHLRLRQAEKRCA